MIIRILALNCSTFSIFLLGTGQGIIIVNPTESRQITRMKCNSVLLNL